MNALDAFVAACAADGLVLDANIDLLFYVGQYDKSLLPRWKRTAQFVAEDFDLLTRLISYFQVRFTTPHVLTEVCNFVGTLKEPARTGVLTQIVDAVADVTERHRSAHILCNSPPFLRVELTDTAVLDLCHDGVGLVTDDRKLAAECYSAGLQVINFNHLRVHLL